MAHNLWLTLLGGCATFAGSVVTVLWGRLPADSTVVVQGLMTAREWTRLPGRKPKLRPANG